MSRSKSDKIPVDGIDLFYHEAGRGMPLFLLHGWGQTHIIFMGMAKRLARHFRVILLDSRGHGKSSAGEHISIPQMAEDMVGALDRFGIKKAAVLGYSDGGNIALQMAVSYPERLLGVVAISANARPQGLIKPFLWPVRALRGFWIGAEKLGLEVRRPMEMTELVSHNPQITDDQLRGITVPVMLIAGQWDLVRREHTGLLHETIPGSQLLILKRTHHFNIVAKWRKYVDAVEAFLQGLAGERAALP